MKRLLIMIIDFFKNMFKKEEMIVNDTNAIDDTTVIGEPVEVEEPEEAEAEAEVSKVKILIDNGHGYDTPGKKSPYSCNKVLPELPFEEWKWNREIAKPIVEELKALGYDAELIVPEENDVTLKERVRRVNAICNELGKNNVILVSIHSNAAGNGTKWMTARGWSAFTTKGKTKSDALATCLYNSASDVFVGKKIRTDYSDGDPDWEENFYIIRNTACSAVLTENFFYDNVDDVTYLLSEEGHKDIVKCHVDGIIEYLKTV